MALENFSDFPGSDPSELVPQFEPVDDSVHLSDREAEVSRRGCQIS